MKLVLAIINTRDIKALRMGLVEADYRFTELGTTGGFLRQGNTTLLIGVDDARVDSLLELLGRHCRRREVVVNVAGAETQIYGNTVGDPRIVTVGGAQVFVLAVERGLALE